METSKLNQNDDGLFKNNRTLFEKLFKSPSATIVGEEFSCKKLWDQLTGCNFKEIFHVDLEPENENKNIHDFEFKEDSAFFQRVCLKKSNRSFFLNGYYNTSSKEESYDYSKPYLKIERLNGGLCAERAEFKVSKDGKNEPIGFIKEYPVELRELAGIYTGRNILKYQIKLYNTRKERSFCLNCCYICCCCGCCGKFCTDGFSKEEDNNFQIQEKKQKIGEINYPCKIIFPKDATPDEKLLLIISRIFIVYTLDKSDSFAEKAGDKICDRISLFDICRCLCPCCC